MSHLVVSNRAQGIAINVLAFSSPMFGSIQSAQTKKEAVHFPIKISQPEVQFDVVFRGEREFETFQKFVRNHQKQALVNTELLTLSWPERNINNWTGTIKSFKGGGQRFNVAPRARFVVELVNSMVSTRTDLASTSAGWRSIYGEYGPVGSVLRLPTVAEGQALMTTTGQDIFNRGTSVGPTPAPTGNTPVAPQPPGPGILPGS